jgi:hypothetical protein
VLFFCPKNSLIYFHKNRIAVKPEIFESLGSRVLAKHIDKRIAIFVDFGIGITECVMCSP